jgi:phosphoglycolate phosphatase
MYGRNMKKIDLMVFDLDGTLIDSGDDIVSSVNHTLNVLNIPILTRETIIGFVGDGVRELITRSIGKERTDKLEIALGIFSAYYSEHLFDTTRVYSGVTEVLEYFGDKKKVIITNKLHDFTVEIVEKLGICGYFDKIIGMGKGIPKKPDPYLLHSLMKEFGVEGDRTVVVGDGNNDVLLAKNAGALSCAFLSGLGDVEKLLELDPEYVYKDIRQLKTFFC